MAQLIRALVIPILFFASSCSGAPVQVLNIPQTLSGSSICQASNPCAGLNTVSFDPQYICGDWRLGPRMIPAAVPLLSDLAAATATYERFGGLCPGEYINKWWNNSANGFIYPPGYGFLLDSRGLPIQAQIVLPAGTLLDRFGGETSTDSFFSPYASSYEQRALPPYNLNPFVPNAKTSSIENITYSLYPNRYHVYVVMLNITAQAGPISPWFGQRGLGTQFLIQNISVNALLEAGVLERITEFY